MHQNIIILIHQVTEYDQHPYTNVYIALHAHTCTHTHRVAAKVLQTLNCKS